MAAVVCSAVRPSAGNAVSNGGPTRLISTSGPGTLAPTARNAPARWAVMRPAESTRVPSTSNRTVRTAVTLRTLVRGSRVTFVPPGGSGVTLLRGGRGNPAARTAVGQALVKTIEGRAWRARDQRTHLGGDDRAGAGSARGRPRSR